MNFVNRIWLRLKHEANITDVNAGWYIGEPYRLLELSLFEYFPLHTVVVNFSVLKFGFSIIRNKY